jgi:hypothetical protein
MDRGNKRGDERNPKYGAPGREKVNGIGSNYGGRIKNIDVCTLERACTTKSHNVVEIIDS